MNSTIDIDGTTYEVFQTLSFNRCVIRYDGLPVLADRGPITGAWVLSAIPVTLEENKVIRAFMQADETDIVPE